MKVNEILTEQIIKKLEAGDVPWRKPWKSSFLDQKNAITKRPYRGLNVMLLAMQGYECPEWATYKQIEEKGGHVRKGEKSTAIVFWKFSKFKEKDAKGEEIERQTAFTRYYRVFNLEQCEGIEWEKPEPGEAVDSIAEAERIVDGFSGKPEILWKIGDRACYAPFLDQVTMPKREQFETSEDLYATLFHELVHSTGHENRLGRSTVGKSYFGSHEYSKEELIAEIGAAFLCSKAGIVQKTLDNSAAYIKHWLKALKDDANMVVMAAAQAQKAFDLILGVKVERGAK